MLCIDDDRSLPMASLGTLHLPYDQIKPGFLFEGDLENRCMKKSVVLTEQ